MKRLTTLAAAVLLSASPAQAYNWVKVGYPDLAKSKGKVLFQVQHVLSMSSIREVNGVRYATMGTKAKWKKGPWKDLEKTSTVKAMCRQGVIAIEGNRFYPSNSFKLLKPHIWVLDIHIRGMKEYSLEYTNDQYIDFLDFAIKGGYYSEYETGEEAFTWTNKMMDDLDSYICGIDRNPGNKGLPEA